MKTNLNYLVKYLPLQITEYEYKPTWLSLGKAGPSKDARQQRAASFRKKDYIYMYWLCYFIITRKFMNFIQSTIEIFAIKNNRI